MLRYAGQADRQIEYMVVSFDDETKKAVLSLRQTEILTKLQSVTLDPHLEAHKPAQWYVSLFPPTCPRPSTPKPAPSHSPRSERQLRASATIPTFHPEYGRYMLESTPGSPFTGLASDLVKVEADMRFRRKIIRSYLTSNEVPMTMTSWPRLGVDGGGFTEPETFPSQESSSKSAYVAQEITNPHARFPYVPSAFILKVRRVARVAWRCYAGMGQAV